MLKNWVGVVRALESWSAVQSFSRSIRKRRSRVFGQFWPFWVRVGVRVRVRVRVRVGSTPIPWSHHEVLPSPRNTAVPEQRTPLKVRTNTVYVTGARGHWLPAVGTGVVEVWHPLGRRCVRVFCRLVTSGAQGPFFLATNDEVLLLLLQCNAWMRTWGNCRRQGWCGCGQRELKQ